MGEPLHQVPVGYHQGPLHHPHQQPGSVYGGMHAFGTQYGPPPVAHPAPMYFMYTHCTPQPQGYYGPTGHPQGPLSFVPTMVPPRASALVPTSTAGGEPVVAAHFADTLIELEPAAPEEVPQEEEEEQEEVPHEAPVKAAQVGGLAALSRGELNNLALLSFHRKLCWNGSLLKPIFCVVRKQYFRPVLLDLKNRKL